jgi:predicted  nucleic acid-binding Zn-ribbon protein
MGIFGFLSKAHLDQVKPTSGNNIKIELIDNQISQQELIITRSQNTLDRLDKALDVYIDKEYVSKGLKERKKQKEERDLLNLAIKNATDEIVKLTNEKATLELEQDKIEAEVGPIKYIAEMIYGDQAKEMFDHAVRIVILILIFVFDPLAVLLLIAANISLNQWRMKRNLTTNNAKEALAKRIEKLEKRNKKLRGYQGFVNKLGYKELDGLDPDEIKLKIDQIMDWNDNEKNNTNN